MDYSSVTVLMQAKLFPLKGLPFDLPPLDEFKLKFLYRDHSIFALLLQRLSDTLSGEYTWLAVQYLLL